MEGSAKASESEMVLETLRRRGWCFGDIEQVKAIIFIQSALADDSSKVADSVESELLNYDLRSIGGNSLPQRKSSYLPGPKVLQISSVRDISKSNVDEFSKSSGGRRLLRLCLTDGQSEITAIEYSHIPSIPDNVVPGTKIRLENKAAIHSGILCLSPTVLTVLGGVVQSLYEEWQMNQKYSGFTRSSLKQLEESSSTSGPPPFEKLQVGLGSFSGNGKSNIRSSGLAAGPSSTETRRTESQGKLDRKADDVNINLKSISTPEKAEEKPSSSSARPKEVVESVPVQNQAAAQKLLQKMTQQNKNDRHPKGWKNRGKAKQEDQVVFTLEEYESRKAKTKPPTKDEVPDTSKDEGLAWELQNQLNLEHSQVQSSSYGANAANAANAEDIMMSMFNYERDHGGGHQMGRGGRGRGKGRGRGRGRGRYG